MNLKNLEEKYDHVYNRKSNRFNLYRFFTQTKLTSIQLPTRQQCLQAYTLRQTISHSKILESFPELAQTFSEQDRKVIRNLDVANVLFSKEKKEKPILKDRTYRFEIRQKAWCYLSSCDRIVPVTILNLSETGFRVVFHDQDDQFNSLIHIEMNDEKSIFVFFATQKKMIQFFGRIIWRDANHKMGCSIDIKNPEWVEYHELISKDFLSKVS